MEILMRYPLQSNSNFLAAVAGGIIVFFPIVPPGSYGVIKEKQSFFHGGFPRYQMTEVNLNGRQVIHGVVNLSGSLTAWQSCGMDTSPVTTKYKNHRFPVEIISHAVWLYFRFCLSFRDVEEILLERGVSVTYEAIRKWCRKFGQTYANQLRRRRPQPGDKWHMDEGFLTIKGEHHYLWRAVDQDGNVLDILVQRRRDKRAAK
jgi:hypothetical protein